MTRLEAFIAALSTKLSLDLKLSVNQTMDVLCFCCIFYYNILQTPNLFPIFFSMKMGGDKPRKF